MPDTVYTILLSISISVSALVTAANRGWLRPLGGVLRHPVRTMATMLHNVRVMLRG